MYFDIALVCYHHTQKQRRTPTPTENQEHNRTNRGTGGKPSRAKLALHSTPDQSWVSHVGLGFFVFLGGRGGVRGKINQPWVSHVG